MLHGTADSELRCQVESTIVEKRVHEPAHPSTKSLTTWGHVLKSSFSKQGNREDSLLTDLNSTTWGHVLKSSVSMQDQWEKSLLTDLKISELVSLTFWAKIAVLYWCFTSWLRSIVSGVRVFFMWGASTARCQVVQCRAGGNNASLDKWKKLVDVLERWDDGWQRSWKTFCLDVRTRRVRLVHLVWHNWWCQLTWTCKWLILLLQQWGWTYRGRRHWWYCTANETAELIQNLLKFHLRNASVHLLSQFWRVRCACWSGWEGSHLLQYGDVVLCTWVESAGLTFLLSGIDVSDVHVIPFSCGSIISCTPSFCTVILSLLHLPHPR